jgi:Methylamine utilisation protein MauE
MALRDGLGFALGAVLILAAGAKLRRPAASVAALAAFGVEGRVAFATLAAAELGVGAWLLSGTAAAFYAAAGLFGAFAAGVALAVRAGRAGAPCPCFGGRGVLGARTVVRDVALAAGAAVAPSLPDRWAAALAAAAFAVLAVAVWPRRRRPAAALEIESEGPPMGTRPAELPPGLAVFLSEGCPPCRRAARALRRFDGVRTYDEARDAAVWRALAVPGAPYAIAVDGDGVVRAKGTFNTAAQLRSIVATAEHRGAAAGELRVGSAGSSRRGFLATAARLVAGAAGAGTALAVLAPGEAEGFHFCGHTYTTGSCPHPTGLPRVDRHNRPLRAKDGRPVDDLGRLVDAQGRPVDERGALLRDPDGRPLPPAPRSKLCLEAVPARFGFRTWLDGSWHRCCGGHVRKLMDCCSYNATRINGDGALTGYCYQGRKVFCVFYYQTEIPC